VYLLDTCVISEARRHSPQAVQWMKNAQSEALFISAITIGEIMKGIMMKMRTDAPAAAPLVRWLDEMRFVYASRILPIDDAVATTWGRLMGQHRTLPMADALIAATALVNNKVVVTRNVKDFEPMGVPLIDPWAMAR
jgi:predicted nucleic acid-binding protein